IVYRAFWEFKDKHYPPPVFALTGCLLVVLAVVIYSIVWQRREKVGVFDSSRVLAVWQDIMGGFIGLDLSMFGWQKLFHLQFFTPLARLDEPFSSFSGEALTWAYFGDSYPLTCVIGIFQITGAFLLLFRRTRLFGAIFLLPVMLNIVLLNIFYGFEAGDLAHALILLIGLSYLILGHYRRLAAFFFPRNNSIRGSSFIRLVAPKTAIVVFPLLLVLSFGSLDHHPQLTGKYRVQDLSVNGVRSLPASCQDSVLTAVYFEKGDDIVFEFNSLQRRWIGSYRLDRSGGSLVATWRYPAAAKDTLFARLDRGQAGEWRMTGMMGKDSLRMQLALIRKP
ncbi:MAG TPA: hypothetical protein VG605_17280, partial [Puia sp.]|nr:hypothetical protein [Puia sp.]